MPCSHIPLEHWRTRVQAAPVPSWRAQWLLASQNAPKAQSRSVAHDMAHVPLLQMLPLEHFTTPDFVHDSELPSQYRFVKPATDTWLNDVPLFMHVVPA